MRTSMEKRLARAKKQANKNGVSRFVFNPGGRGKLRFFVRLSGEWVEETGAGGVFPKGDPVGSS